MKKIFFISLVMVGLLPMTSRACYTIVAGKKASADGSVLFAHNEDDHYLQLFNFWQVPRQKHQSGEQLQLIHGGHIPQAEQTWAFSWIEDVHEEFSDFYMNEWGVTLSSNACVSKIQDAETTDGGIGYMLRRVVAQRAKTARQGVKIAGQLLDRFGYASYKNTGRTLVIADKNEAWLLDILPGKYWVAQRVPDDAVVLQPNIYVIRKVDFDDTANFITSKKDIRKYAIKKGWYHPRKEKDFDFSYIFSEFRAPYFNQRGYDTRQWRGQQLLSGKTTSIEEAKASGLPFSVIPNHKLTPTDLMHVLRDHYEGSIYDVSGNKKGNPNRSRERTICFSTSQVSVVAQLRADLPKEIAPVLWLSFGRPDVNTYLPFYPVATKIPDFYHFVPGNGGWKASLENHFTPLPGTYDFQPDRAYWIFNDLENISGLNYYKTIEKIRQTWRPMENQAIALQASVEATALALYKNNPDLALRYLQEYSNSRAYKAIRAAKALTNKLKSEVYQ